MLFNVSKIDLFEKVAVIPHILNSHFLCSNLHFQILKNIIHIFTHFFTHTYFKKLQTTILKLLYQTPPKLLQCFGL